MYQAIIRELAAEQGLVGIDAGAVERSMRLRYRTLDHLSRADFRREIEIAAATEAQHPGYFDMLQEA